MKRSRALFVMLAGSLGLGWSPTLLGEEPAKPKTVPVEVTYAELEKRPEAYAGKQVSVVCFAASSLLGSTTLYEKLAGALNEENERLGKILTVKDLTFALAPTPPKIPVWCKVTGVFTPNPDLKKNPGDSWLGTLERIERMEPKPLPDEMVNEAYLEIRRKQENASKAK